LISSAFSPDQTYLCRGLSQPHLDSHWMWVQMMEAEIAVYKTEITSCGQTWKHMRVLLEGWREWWS